MLGGREIHHSSLLASLPSGSEFVPLPKQGDSDAMTSRDARRHLKALLGALAAAMAAHKGTQTVSRVSTKSGAPALAASAAGATTYLALMRSQHRRALEDPSTDQPTDPLSSSAQSSVVNVNVTADSSPSIGPLRQRLRKVRWKPNVKFNPNIERTRTIPSFQGQG